ncbi:uncharacterized protein WM294_010566 isoform 1-T2 [Sarcoramphus papa]
MVVACPVACPVPCVACNAFRTSIYEETHCMTTARAENVDSKLYLFLGDAGFEKFQKLNFYHFLKGWYQAAVTGGHSLCCFLHHAFHGCFENYIKGVEKLNTDQVQIIPHNCTQQVLLAQLAGCFL